LREHLINHARTFIFSTAMPPYLASQIRGALRLATEMNSERAELTLRARTFAEVLRNGGWEIMGSATQIVPAVMGENSAALSAAEYLQGEGFAVRAIRPPTVPPGTARLRFSLTHKVSAKELEQLAMALNMWRSRQPQPTPLAMAGSA